MATQTPNINLTKPAGTDYVNVADFNSNADAVDAAVGNLSQLNTLVKTSLVLAINEARLTGGNNAPYIGDNKHWYEWDDGTLQYVDTTVQAPGGAWYNGTAITGTSVEPTVFATGITYANSFDLYLSTDTANVYVCIAGGDAATATWGYLCNIKGAAGAAGTGNNWYTGSAITGTSTTPTAYATAIESAQMGDHYLNNGTLPDTGREYVCTLGGDAATALWKYNTLLRGSDGSGVGDMLKSTYDTDNDGKVNSAVDSDTVSGFTVAKNVPADAVFTDTVYTHPETHSADIIVDGTTNKAYTATEKTKLFGIATGATADSASSATPAMDGTATAGTEAAFSRGDHVHPSDTTKQDTPATATSLPTSGTELTANTEYRPSAAVGTYQFVFPASGEVWVYFTTDSTFAITFGSGTKYLNGAPTFEASKTYEMSIKDKVVIVAEVTSE